MDADFQVQACQSKQKKDYTGKACIPIETGSEKVHQNNQEEFEDTKVVIRSRKLKDMLYIFYVIQLSDRVYNVTFPA